ncbi:hypothetical protein DERP_003864 [Dermatophagoides pteronyssinus]|uniref:Uncharacterized protein n=1 Tax=Dermatophagoides pteronyssinus TaxID=6956 RepID=A0ABQ8J7K9_DERPT|nr:hypothetical protein DERP_003864 [Dermatophagoides pteronyssinus]
MNHLEKRKGEVKAAVMLICIIFFKKKTQSNDDDKLKILNNPDKLIVTGFSKKLKDAASDVV